MTLNYGFPIPAGGGVSTILAEIDFETYSEAGYVWAGDKWAALPHAPQGKKGLSIVGAANYAMHPSTEVLCMAWNLHDGRGPQLWVPGDPNPDRLFTHIAAGLLIEAWNSSFEHWIWNHVCVVKYGWPPLPQEQLRCAMAKARAHGLPGGLEHAGAVLGADELKDPAGKRLLGRFSVPRNPTAGDPRTRIDPAGDPEGEALHAYCRQDIAAEGAISRRCPDLDGDGELPVWQLDQRINYRGVGVDLAAAEDCAAVIDAAHERYNAELHAITGGAVARASEVAKLLAWLAGQGCYPPNLDEDAVSDALAAPALLTPTAYRALSIRQAVGSAAVKKAFSLILRTAPDGRAHDLYVYHGARTGRPAGEGPQPTNVPNSGPAVRHCECGAYYAGRPACPHCGAPDWASDGEEWSAEAAEFALSIIATRSLDLVEHYFGDAMPTVSGCLRGLFVAAPGNDLICSDYSAIEAVVLAMLAGEQWRIDVFRTHGKIYEASAARIFGVPLDEILEYPKAHGGNKHPLRKLGKVAELALGYQGWLGAWRQFDGPGEDSEVKSNILKWRADSPAIVEFWGGQQQDWKPRLFGVEGAFVRAVLAPGAIQEFRGLQFRYDSHDDILYLRLLSGRRIRYWRPRLTPSTVSYKACTYDISFEGWNTNPKNGPRGWIRMDTWGGRLTENIVQATARDIQWHAMLALEAAGYPIVLHVYDECVAEVPVGFGSIEELERIMSTMPPWASDWPVVARGGWRGRRYRK